MAARVSVRTGNWSDSTSSGPWGDSGTANAAVTTATGAPGTLTDTRKAWVANQFAGATVTCNGKTITVASNTATVITGTAGWSGGGNPGNGNAYTVGSVAGVVNTAPVPLAGDDVTIASGTIVTVDDATASTIDIGSDSGANDAIVINGKLRTANTSGSNADPTVNHIFRTRGHFNLAAGGELNIGADLTSLRLPQTKSFTFELNYSATPARNKYQFKWSGALNVNAYNRDVQHGRDLLASTAASAQKNITLLGSVPASWAAGDQIILSATDGTSTHHEVAAIASISTATITTVSNLVRAHLGAASEPLRGECINAERNVIFKAIAGSTDITVSTANGWSMTMASTATGTSNWVRFQDLTYGANDYWIDYIGTTAGNATLADCIFVNCEHGLFRCRAAAGDGLSVLNCSAYLIGVGIDAAQFGTSSSTSAWPYDFSAFWIVGGQGSGTGNGFEFLNERRVRLAGSRVSGMGTGFLWNLNAASGKPPTVAGGFNSLSAHCQFTHGFAFQTLSGMAQYDVTGWWAWAQQTGNGFTQLGATAIVPVCSCTISDLQCVNNGGNGISGNVGFANVRLNNPVITGNATAGWAIADNTRDLTVVNLVATGNTPNDVGLSTTSAQVDVDLINPNVGTYASMTGGIRPARVRSQRDGQTTHYNIRTNIGTSAEETSARHTASGYAWKLTPATIAGGQRFRSPVMRVAAQSGLPFTLTVWTAKDAAYTGAQQSLRLMGGLVQGISADVVASAVNAGAHTPPTSGDWEQLSLTATPTEAGEIEFVFECDGSAGNVYWDDVGFSQ